RSGMWREMARIIYEVQPRFAFVENSPMLTSRGLGTVLGDLASMGFDARWGVLGAADVGANHQRNRIWIVARNLANASMPNESACSHTTKHRKGTSGKFGGSSSSQGEMADTDSPGLGTGWREGLHSKRETGFIAAPSNTTMANANGLRELQPQGGQCDQRGWFGNGSEDMGNTSCEGLSIPRPQSVGSHWEQVGRPAASASWWQAEPNVGRVADGVAARVDRLKAIGNGQVPLCAATAWRILQ
ncbi:S-adenosyl-L-methionine-dependent methyltransferase, partial [uncultured Caudovirales phage]